MQFDPTGQQLLTFNGGVPLTGAQQGGDGTMIGQSCCTITPSQTANQAFGRAEFEFSDKVTGFV